MTQTRKHCARCGKAYDVPRYSDQCPHRYATLHAKIAAGESHPMATRRYEDNPNWRMNPRAE